MSVRWPQEEEQWPVTTLGAPTRLAGAWDTVTAGARLDRRCRARTSGAAARERAARRSGGSADTARGPAIRHRPHRRDHASGNTGLPRYTGPGQGTDGIHRMEQVTDGIGRNRGPMEQDGTGD